MGVWINMKKRNPIKVFSGFDCALRWLSVDPSIRRLHIPHYIHHSIMYLERYDDVKVYPTSRLTDAHWLALPADSAYSRNLNLHNLFHWITTRWIYGVTADQELQHLPGQVSARKIYELVGELACPEGETKTLHLIHLLYKELGYPDQS